MTLHSATLHNIFVLSSIIIMVPLLHNARVKLYHVTLPSTTLCNIVTYCTLGNLLHNVTSCYIILGGLVVNKSRRVTLIKRRSIVMSCYMMLCCLYYFMLRYITLCYIFLRHIQNSWHPHNYTVMLRSDVTLYFVMPLFAALHHVTLFLYRKHIRK